MPTSKNTKETGNLGYLGYDGQMRIVKALIEDRNLFKEVENELDQNAFAGENSLLLKDIVAALKDISSEKGYQASYDELAMVLKQKARTNVDLEEIDAIIKELKSDRYYEGFSTAKDIIRTFFKQQATLRILRKGMEDLAIKGYQSGKTISAIRDALNKVDKNCVSESGTTVYDLFDRVMSRTKGERVPTGIETLDNAMNGGVTKGMVGLLIAGTGAGKTTLMSMMANGAARCGKKVLQIFFEENEEEIAAKHYAILSGQYTSSLMDTADKKAIWNTIGAEDKDAMRNNIRLMRMNNGSTQVEDIKDRLEKLINEGYKPDVVFVDYFSCLQKSSDRRNDYSNEAQAGEKCMKKLEQMANDYNIVLWIAEQTNRDGVNSSTPYGRIGTIQGSYRATQPASFILYLDRNNCDGNQANLYMDKCRGCQRQKWEGITLDNGNCTIDMSSATLTINTLTVNEF